MYRKNRIVSYFIIEKKEILNFLKKMDEFLPIDKSKIYMSFSGYDYIKYKSDISYDFELIIEFLAFEELDGYSLFTLLNEIDYEHERLVFNIDRYEDENYYISLNYFNFLNYDFEKAIKMYNILLSMTNIIFLSHADQRDESGQDAGQINNGIYSQEVISGGTLGWGAEERFKNWGAGSSGPLYFSAAHKMYFGKAMGEIVPIHLIENFEFAQKCFEFNQELIKIELFEPKVFDNYKLIRERQKKFWLELNYKKHILTYLDKIKKDDAYLYNLYLELKKKKRYKRLGI